MFVLKIIVISSALLNVGISATQCSSNQSVKFHCQDPTCMNTVEGGTTTGRFLTKSKNIANIVGYNDNNFLVKNNKGGLSIVPIREIKVTLLAKKEFWKHEVNIHKATSEICESNNEENHNDSIIAKIGTNTAESITKTSEAIDTPQVIEDVNLKLNNNNEQNDEKINNISDLFTLLVKEDILDEDLDGSIEIESEEDEFDMGAGISLELSNNDVDKAKIIVNESLSENSEQIPNSKTVYLEKNDFNQNNIPKPTNPQKLENDSSLECALDSCVKETFDVEKERKELTEDLSNSISQVNEDSSHQLNKKFTAINPQLSNAKKIDDFKEESTNNLALKNPIAVKQDINNDTEEFKKDNSHQHKNENIPVPHLPDIEKGDGIIKENINNVVKSNSNTDSLQDINNEAGDFGTDSFHQQKNEQILLPQNLSNIEKTDGTIKEPINNVMTNSNIDSLRDFSNEAGEFDTDSFHQQKNKQIPVPQLPNIQKTDSTIKEPINNIKSPSFSTDSLQDISNSIKELNETQQEKMKSDFLQDNTKTIDQQGNSNYAHLPSLETGIEFKNKNGVINDNALSSNSIGERSPDYNNTSTINEIQNNPDFGVYINETKSNLPIVTNDLKETELQNTQETNEPIIKSTTSDIDLVDSEMIQSTSLQELMNETNIIASADNQTTVDDANLTETLNTKSNDQCTSVNGCLHSADSTPKYEYESAQQQYKPDNKISYENDHKTMEPSNEKSKEYESKSFVASFGHPDACSGINCLKFKRNVEKTIKYPLPIPKQNEPDVILQSTITDLELEDKSIVNEAAKDSSKDFNFFDYFQNWLSSPASNSVDFLWTIFNGFSIEYSDVYPNQINSNEKIAEHNKHINHSKLYFIVVAIVTLLFSLIYYKYQKGTYENHLLTLLAAKDQSLLIVEKELSLLKEQSLGNIKSTIENNFELENINEHLTKSEDIISSQALRIEKLEQEVEELTESGMEMHTLLSSALESSTKNTEKLNTLKVKLIDSERLVAALTQKNFNKTTELEKKKGEIKTLQTTIDELTNKNMSLVEDNANISSQLEQILTKSSLKESKLLSEINSLHFELDKQTNALVNAENEVLQSKNALQEMLSQKFNLADAKKLSSSVKLTAELKSAKQMCEGYKQKLDESSKSNQQYLDHIDALKSDIVNLKDNLSKVEKIKEDTINKLNILTKFFKEQEKEYLKQINEKSMLADNKEGESSDLNERIKYLNQEIANYKSEIQTLKKEITDQEASFKIQVSAADKKASDYWISFRQAERKLKEMELETAQLRNKLTMVDKKLENGTKSIDSSKDFEDELLDIPLPTVSPDFALLDFEPPPPIFPVDQRLPPLGALGQAPSPPAPLSRRHNRSLSPGSPPPSQRSSVFRPLPQRYNYMNRQSSLGHSDESLDK